MSENDNSINRRDFTKGVARTGAVGTMALSHAFR